MKTNQLSFAEVINRDQPVIVDFFAEWCGPCRIMAPILQEVKQSLKDDVTIIKIDVDKNDQLAQLYQITGVPTLIVFKNGEIKWRRSGVVPSKQLQSVVQQFL